MSIIECNHPTDTNSIPDERLDDRFDDRLDDQFDDRFDDRLDDRLDDRPDRLDDWDDCGEADIDDEGDDDGHCFIKTDSKKIIAEDSDSDDSFQESSEIDWSDDDVIEGNED